MTSLAASRPSLLKVDEDEGGETEPPQGGRPSALGEALSSLMKESGSIASSISGEGAKEQIIEDDIMSVASREDVSLGGKRVGQKKSLKTSRPPSTGEELAKPKGAAKTRGNVRTQWRFPVKDHIPEQPTLALPAGNQHAWQERWDEAAGSGGASCSKPSRLCWYGRELQQLCGQVLLAASEQIMELQAGQRAAPELWEAAGQLFPLLLEVSQHLFGASLVTDKVSKLLVEGSSRGDLPEKAALQRLVKLHALCFKSEGVQTPAIRFKPHGAEDAFSAMHAELTRMQASGQALGMTLRRLGAEWGETAEEKLKRLLDVHGLSSQLFLLVPILELMLQKLRNLLVFVLRNQADKAVLPSSSLHSLAREMLQEVGQETLLDVAPVNLLDVEDEVPHEKGEDEGELERKPSSQPLDDTEEASTASSPRRGEKKSPRKVKTVKASPKAKSKR